MTNEVSEEENESYEFADAMRYRINDIYSEENENGIKKDWKEAHLVLDTCSILDLYRYSKETRDIALKSIKAFHNDCWIPHEVVKELKCNLDKIVRNSDDSIDLAKQTVKNATSKAIETIKNFILKRNEEQKSFSDDSYEKIKKIIAKARDEIYKELENELRNYHSSKVDPILSELKEKIKKCGPEPSEKKIKDWEKEGKKRFEKEIPPGYSDKEKDKGNKYGDYFIWKEIIEYADKKKCPIIFVTNDLKEDWWVLSKKESKGVIVKPRCELQEEFFDETRKEIYILSLSQFIKKSSLFNTSLKEENKIISAEKEINAVSRKDALAEIESDVDSPKATGAKPDIDDPEEESDVDSPKTKKANNSN